MQLDVEKYISKNKNKVNKKYYPKFHLAAPIGWINDPNGFVYYKEQYHLFYQYHPYDTKWGPMHWGHAVSKDLVNWEYVGVALVPDKAFDKDGCFSGSALVKDDKLYLMYTGHIIDEETKKIRQVQNIAFSEDGIHFEKYRNNPVIDERNLPEVFSISDFRDPKMFEKNGKYYVVIGNTDTKNGCVQLFESENLLNWTFKNSILSDDERLGNMVECPDFFTINNRDFMICSSMNYFDKELRQTIPHKVWLVEGKFDLDNGIFMPINFKTMDSGMDFYAPQSTEGKNGERIYIPWMQRWSNFYLPDELKHNWVGQMGFPRIIDIDSKGVVQQSFYPAPCIPKTIIKARGKYSCSSVGKIVIEEASNFSCINLSAKNEMIQIYPDENGYLQIDFTNVLQKTNNDLEKNNLQIYTTELKCKEADKVEIILDKSSIELAVNGSVASFTLYLNNEIEYLEID